MKTWHVIAAAVAAVLVSAIVLWLAIGPKSGPDPATAAAAHAAVLYRPHAASVGRDDARVHIVEFLDPACETCRDFYPLVKKLLADNPERVRLTVRMVAFHKGSDAVVRALEASKKQGRFWPTLERALASQSRWTIQHTVHPDKFWEQLQGLDVDLVRLKADMESPDVLQAVALDAQDAKMLKVVQTPEYFVNGRGLPEFGWEPLRRLVGDEMAKAYR